MNERLDHDVVADLEDADVSALDQPGQRVEDVALLDLLRLIDVNAYRRVAAARLTAPTGSRILPAPAGRHPGPAAPHNGRRRLPARRARRHIQGAAESDRVDPIDIRIVSCPAHRPIQCDGLASWRHHPRSGPCARHRESPKEVVAPTPAVTAARAAVPSAHEEDPDEEQI